MHRARCGAVALFAILCGLIAHQAWTPAGAAAREPDVLPRRLAETGLYDPSRPGEIDPRNRAFVPQYPLWTDGLTKRRWVYLPPGTAIDATDEHEWRFPAGTRFWKEFSHNGRRVETRMSWKTGDRGWVFASYAWNEDGTDAMLAPVEGVHGAAEVAPGKRHAIPSRTDCTACHGTTRAGPLGFTALQLSTDRDPQAIHGEAAGPGMLTLRELIDGALIESAGDLDLAPRIRTVSAETRSALGYLVANCGGCHDGRGDIAAAAPVLRLRDLLADGDAVASAFVDTPTRWQIPGEPVGSTMLVRPGAPEHSALLRRMTSRAPSSQMPPLGTVLRDDAAVEFLSRWIAQLAER